MTTVDLLLIMGLVFICLPILSYLVVKFGVAGYLRAKRREKINQKEKHE